MSTSLSIADVEHRCGMRNTLKWWVSNFSTRECLKRLSKSSSQELMLKTNIVNSKSFNVLVILCLALVGYFVISEVNGMGNEFPEVIVGIFHNSFEEPISQLSKLLGLEISEIDSLVPTYSNAVSSFE